MGTRAHEAVVLGITEGEVIREERGVSTWAVDGYYVGWRRGGEEERYKFCCESCAGVVEEGHESVESFCSFWVIGLADCMYESSGTIPCRGVQGWKLAWHITRMSILGISSLAFASFSSVLMISAQAVSTSFISARLSAFWKKNCPVGHNFWHSAMMVSADLAFRPTI